MAQRGVAANVYAECVAESRPKKGPPCSVGAALEKLGDERKAFEDVLARRGEITATAISRAFKRRGFDINAWVIGHHRRRDCRCG